jgi:hypothetical protein
LSASSIRHRFAPSRPTKAIFRRLNLVSGDDSGTHVKELALWKNAELDPAGQDWYLETGQGQGATLSIASEKGAYALTDRGTFLAYKSNVDLEILVEGDPFLLNVYHVITVNPRSGPIKSGRRKGICGFHHFFRRSGYYRRFGGKFGSLFFLTLIRATRSGPAVVNVDR